MPRLPHPPHHTIEALVHFFAYTRRERALSGALLVLACKVHVPEAEIVNGYAIVDGNAHRYAWLRLNGKVYDVYLKAWNMRLKVGELFMRHELTKTLPEGTRLVNAESTSFSDEFMRDCLVDIATWTLPECPACRGLHKAHSCDENCQSPWKEELLWCRPLRPRPHGRTPPLPSPSSSSSLSEGR